MDERCGAWSRLLALFRLMHAGDISGCIRGRGGKLFDPAVFPFLLGQGAPESPPDPAPVTDGCILLVLDGLMMLAGERLGGGQGQRPDLPSLHLIALPLGPIPLCRCAAWHSIQP